MRIHPNAMSIWKCVGTFVLCVLLGNLCFQTLLVNMSAQFGKFSECAASILQGHAWLYAFQSRILPSMAVGGLSKLFSLDWLAATFVFYRLMFVINALAFGLICRPWQRPFAETVYTLCAFHVAYMASVLAGFWLYTFDLQNQFCLTLLYAIFLSEVRIGAKVLLLALLFAVWQFTFEEAIYLPMLYLLYMNIEEILHFRIAALLRSGTNWMLVTLVLLSIAVTHFTRAFFLHGTTGIGSDHSFLGQTIMADVNFQDLMRELRLIFWPGLLRDNFWWQGPAIFVLYAGLAILLIQPLWRKDRKATAIFGLFACMALITALFAHLQETNTFIPMLLTLFVLIVRNNGREANSASSRHLPGASKEAQARD